MSEENPFFGHVPTDTDTSGDDGSTGEPSDGQSSTPTVPSALPEGIQVVGDMPSAFLPTNILLQEAQQVFRAAPVQSSTSSQPLDTRSRSQSVASQRVTSGDESGGLMPVRGIRRHQRRSSPPVHQIQTLGESSRAVVTPQVATPHGPLAAVTPTSSIRQHEFIRHTGGSVSRHETAVPKAKTVAKDTGKSKKPTYSNRSKSNGYTRIKFDPHKMFSKKSPK